MRKLFVAGNWKMNLSLAEAVGLAVDLRNTLADMDGIDLAVFPPAVFAPAVADVLKGSNVAVGCQNMHSEPSGAFTGEIAGAMVRDIGGTCVILGHSERRHVIGETDADVNAKLHAALKVGLNPIVCVGELLEQRDAGQTNDVVKTQVVAGLEGVTAEQMAGVTVAYEPVWAIGTGRTASREQAQEVHAMIRGVLAELFGDDVANAVRIQYGGSVKPDNAADLLSAPDIDGALVGGASLKADSFAAIAKAGL